MFSVLCVCFFNYISYFLYSIAALFSVIKIDCLIDWLTERLIDYMSHAKTKERHEPTMYVYEHPSYLLSCQIVLADVTHRRGIAPRVLSIQTHSSVSEEHSCEVLVKPERTTISMQQMLPFFCPWREPICVENNLKSHHTYIKYTSPECSHST